jgi:CcmD family protein
MNETLKEIYSLAFTQWPLVAAAYAVIWVGLMVYVGFAWRRVADVERQVNALEEAVARRNAKAGVPTAD